MAVATCVVLGACGRKPTIQQQALAPELARAVSQERALAKELAAVATNPVPREVWTFFDLLQRNDWPAATNAFEQLRMESGGYANPQPATNFWGMARQLLSGPAAAPRPSALRDMLWCPVHETFGMGESFHEWDLPLLRRFGHDIIDSVPTNSIYFGGTDPGRFVITALSESYRDGRPFFTVTQNALADGRYLEYLRYIYGAKIYIPTAADSQTAFTDYLTDAQKRMNAGKLKPGEDVKMTGGRVTVSGQVAVMAINGLLAKKIFDQNPGREFFIEESFALDWMYPYLTPHGLIFKLNREPLKQLDEAVLAKDHEYWQRYTAQLIGDWLRDETSVKEVCAFAERVYVRRELGGFSGDKAFATNAMAQKTFSKLRSSLGGLYAWRYGQAGGAEEKARLGRETDYAFRQAVALCPYSPEAVFRYVSFLMEQGRKQDALLIAETCQHLDPGNVQVSQLVRQIKGYNQ